MVVPSEESAHQTAGAGDGMSNTKAAMARTNTALDLMFAPFALVPAMIGPRRWGFAVGL